MTQTGGATRGPRHQTYEGDEPGFTVTAGSTTLRIPRSEVLALDEARSSDGAYRERRDRFRGLLLYRLLQELVAVTPRPAARTPSVATWNATVGSSASAPHRTRLAVDQAAGKRSGASLQTIG
ncbi:hypothetical protein ABTY98_00070 [Streptomyces sp. NPDC096040]|uniref:hypothetical protein n=1 Tax=Streptomyces sp. NPDC096040 TaxID=3155541 RepID=UPI003321E92D